MPSHATPAPDPAPAGGSPAPSGTTFPLAELQAGVPDGVEPTRKEEHLSEEDFMAAFKMDMGSFKALPGWKRTGLKKAAGLF